MPTVSHDTIRDRIANVVLWVGYGAAFLVIAGFAVVIASGAESFDWGLVLTIAAISTAIWLPCRALFYVLTGR